MVAISRFATFLKESRLSAELSQKEVSDKLGYGSSQFISNWERGLSAPPIKVIRKLADMYSVSADEMFQLLLQETLQQVTLDFKKKIKKIL